MLTVYQQYTNRQKTKKVYTYFQIKNKDFTLSSLLADGENNNIINHFSKLEKTL